MSIVYISKYYTKPYNLISVEYCLESNIDICKTYEIWECSYT